MSEMTSYRIEKGEKGLTAVFQLAHQERTGAIYDASRRPKDIFSDQKRYGHEDLRSFVKNVRKGGQEPDAIILYALYEMDKMTHEMGS